MATPKLQAQPKPKPQVVIHRERRATLAKTIKVVRAAVWRRDGGRCRVCARRGHQVHHVQYRSQGGRWTIANCVLLCRQCHQEVHARILVISGSNANDPAGLVFARHRWW